MNDLSVLRVSYNQKLLFSFMKQIFVTCPSCDGKRAYFVKYDTLLKVLKDRSWLICEDCDYEIPMKEFKKSLFCV